MSEQLALAVQLGPTPEGRRRFGQGLHVLEDYFAHSNFVELALRSHGYTQVFPWAGHATVGQGTVTPIVPGMFGSWDTAASISYVVAEHMSKATDCTPGVRSPGAEIALILMGDKDPAMAKKAEASLANYEHFQRSNPRFFRGFCQTMDFMLGWVGQSLGFGLHQSAALIDDAQSAFVDNWQTSLDPTHSQLAKDHDDHALHVLAAGCAKIAVEAVGKMMAAAWRGDVVAAQQVVPTARKFFVHPFKLDERRNDSDVMRVMNHVKTWAAQPGNRTKLERCYSVTVLEHWQKSSEHAPARKKAREVIQEGQHLRHSTTPVQPDDPLDQLVRDLNQWLSQP
jgi:hypothetical protein